MVKYVDINNWAQFATRANDKLGLENEERLDIGTIRRYRMYRMSVDRLRKMFNVGVG